MSLLSVAVQVYGQPKIVGSVPARDFYPPPKVASVILRIEPHRQYQPVKPTEDFFTVVRAGFSAPRKQLRNALAQGLDLPPAESSALLKRAVIAPNRRAETLSLGEWDRLRAILAEERKTPLAQS
jgi:16S rRNA (adenine1518-N6/adenine1519-N6)-dimethyltransferase